MNEKLIKKLIDCAEQDYKFSFKKEKEIKEEYGEELYNRIYKEFIDHWSYEISERIDSINLEALILDAVKKAYCDENLKT